jgi:hypothetical protein
MSKQIPAEIRSGVKLWKGVYFLDLCIIFFYWMFFDMYSSFIHPSLYLFCTIFNVSIGIFLALPSLTNPGRRNYEAILIGFLRDAKTYHYETTEGCEIKT